MILRTIYVYISELGLPSEYTYSFTKASRFICNWLEREVLKKIRFETDGFDRIVVNLCSKPNPTAFINPSRVASVDLVFDRSAIDAVSGSELAELQMDLLRHGLMKCASTFAIPLKELLAGLDEFSASGMKNEWLHKKRVFKNEGLVASLGCKMTQSVFELWLTVLRGDREIFACPIFTSDPDEIAFEPKFKDIVIADGRLVVTTKRGQTLWSRPLTELT